MHARQRMIKRFSLTVRPLQAGDAGEGYGLVETGFAGPSTSGRRVIHEEPAEVHSAQVSFVVPAALPCAHQLMVIDYQNPDRGRITAHEFPPPCS
jgi:hypothetical protein